MTPALAVLARARAILAEPSSWTKGGFARKSKRGQIVRWNSDEATCWCLDGAINKAGAIIGAGQGDIEDAEEAIKTPRNCNIALFNDRPSTRHRDVLRVLDRSIAALSGDAGGEEMR